MRCSTWSTISWNYQGAGQGRTIGRMLSLIWIACCLTPSTTRRWQPKRRDSISATIVRPTFPQFIVGDPVRLRRVVANLVNNAIKFTERGEVMVRALCVKDESGASLLQIVVEDTGSGIRTEKQRKVFDAFWRDDSAAGTDGVGLGLSICDELVIQMGGSIRVESQPKRGSRFFISLPLAPHANQRLCDRPLFGCRYLLVSEPSRRRSAYRKMLERAGAEIVTCRAAAFQRLLSRGDIHMLSCDGVVMDCLNDAELEMALANQFLKVMGQKRLVLLVPRSATTVWTRCEELPGATPIAKPVDYGQLVQTLQCEVTVAMADEAMPKTDPLRILLADDCEVNQMVAAGLLGMYGHRVDTVTNGQLAVDAVATEAYDLVLMDLEMPGLDGMRAARAMQEQTNTRRPIIGMTAHVDEAVLDRCKGSGMDTCLSKPLDPRTLLSAIAELTRRESIETSADVLDREVDTPHDPMASKKADQAHDGLSPNVTHAPQRTGLRAKSRRRHRETT